MEERDWEREVTYYYNKEEIGRGVRERTEILYILGASRNIGIGYGLGYMDKVIILLNL